MRRTLLILATVALLGVIVFRAWRGPDPEEVLAGIDVPPAPVLSPEDELASFRIAPGYRVELVAAEPLVVDPVAMDWDDEGRLYVVEMRGFMPDIEGQGEDRPVGRIVVLEDTDADGMMDRSRVFLDGLVLPDRAWTFLNAFSLSEAEVPVAGPLGWAVLGAGLAGAGIVMLRRQQR